MSGPTAHHIQAYITKLFKMRYQAALAPFALKGKLDGDKMLVLAQDLATAMTLEAIEGWQGDFIPVVRVEPIDVAHSDVKYTVVTSVMLVHRAGLGLN